MVVVQIALWRFVKREVDWIICPSRWRQETEEEEIEQEDAVSSILSQYAREGEHTLSMGMADKDSHSRRSLLFQEKALSGTALSPRQQ